MTIRVQGLGLGVQGLGFRGLGFRGLGFRGLRVCGFRGFGVSGFRGLGFRVLLWLLQRFFCISTASSSIVAVKIRKEFP